MQELAGGKGKHPVSGFIFACSYMGTFVFLSVSLSLSLSLSVFYFTSLHSFFLIHASFFFPRLPSLQLQGFWLYVIFWKSIRFHSLARLYGAKQRGMETVQTLFLSHTHICACICTLEGQPKMNKSVIQLKQTHVNLKICTNLASALPCHSQLLTSWGNCWGHRKPTAKHRFSRCINDPWPREEHFIVPHPEQMPRPRHGQPSAGGRWSQHEFKRSPEKDKIYILTDTVSGETSGWADSSPCATFQKQNINRGSSILSGKIKSNSKGGMWLYYNITEIMCVVLWS